MSLYAILQITLEMSLEEKLMNEDLVTPIQGQQKLVSSHQPSEAQMFGEGAMFGMENNING